MLARHSSSQPNGARQYPPSTLSRRESCYRCALALLATLLPAFVSTPALSASAFAAEKKDKNAERQPVTDTLIKVTTFTELGGTLRGATLKLLPADNDGNAVKGKALQGVTNGMGEFPFHVPKTEAKYVLRAQAKGFEPAEKMVEVRGEDQLDVFLQLPVRK